MLQRYIIVSCCLLILLVACGSNTTSIQQAPAQATAGTNDQSAPTELVPAATVTEPADGGNALLTITAVLECADTSSDSSCRRMPMETTFMIKQGEAVVMGETPMAGVLENIELPPGTYTIIPTDFLPDPSIDAPAAKTVTLEPGESKTVPFTFIQN